MKSTILTIAIPTFNRQPLLETMLQLLVPLCANSNLQILVIDNCSNDGTWEWLCSVKDKMGITIEQNPFNFGIEGNIIQALTRAKGKYIWLLSDHMNINVNEVNVFIEKLNSGLEFSFGYACIDEYGTVLPEVYKPFTLGSISRYSLGELLFFTGNISAFVINRKCLSQCIRTVFRFAAYSYPQLGVFAHAACSDTFVELPQISNFKLELKPRGISYDTFRSRFIGFVRALDEIVRLNPMFKHVHKALKTPRLIGALGYDAILTLSFKTSRPVKPLEFAYCIRRYPGKIRIFLIGCLLLSMLPEKMKISTSRIFFRTFFTKYYDTALQDYKMRINPDTIRE